MRLSSLIAAARSLPSGGCFVELRCLRMRPYSEVTYELQRAIMHKICLLVLILTGCGAAGPIGPPAITATLPGATTTTPEAAATTPVPAATVDNEIVAVWTRSGGFAGLTDTLTIYADGRLVTEGDSGSHTVQGDTAAVDTLHETVAGSEWQDLNDTYGEQFPDAFAYTIKAGGKTVTTYDGIETPELLTQVMQQINVLFTAANQPNGS